MAEMIRNRKELREAYRFLTALKDISSPAVNKYAKELKREIREYNKREQNKPTVIIKDNGIDGYVALEQFDNITDGFSRQEAEDWFKQNLEIQSSPSAYDCTGKAFTTWHKVVRRRGHWYAYHSVCFDI